jgi:hypothetical protein
VAVTIVLLAAGGFAYWRHEEHLEALGRGASLLRSHMSGRSPAAAAASGEASAAADMFARFHRSEEHIKRMQEFGKHELFTMTHCPEALGIGGRPENQKAPFYAGNTCEPWMARFAIVMLDQLLHTSMKALEWGSGSSSQWTLMRVGHLTSVEHDATWAPRVREALEKFYGAEFLEQHWESHAVPRGTPTEGKDSMHDPESFGDYYGAAFLPNDEGIFDYIAVDGRSRVNCIKRALPLLKPEGGVLLLDNSDRDYYAEAFEVVPKHWLRFDDIMVSKERTTIWVSCRKGACGEAAR